MTVQAKKTGEKKPKLPTVASLAKKLADLEAQAVKWTAMHAYKREVNEQLESFEKRLPPHPPEARKLYDTLEEELRFVHDRYKLTHARTYITSEVVLYAEREGGLEVAKAIARTMVLAFDQPDLWWKDLIDRPIHRVYAIALALSMAREA